MRFFTFSIGILACRFTCSQCLREPNQNDSFEHNTYEEEAMNFLAAAVSLCLALLLLCGGCSGDEPPPPPREKFKVVKPIDKSEFEKFKTELAVEEQKPETEAGEAPEGKTAPLKPESTWARRADFGRKKPAAEEKPGDYTITKGENLSSIAARADVYGDPLKWPILYRLNMDKFGSVLDETGFPEAGLPEGLRLEIVSADQKNENLQKRLGKVWVVNVISNTMHDKINPPAIRLMKNGYPVYITRARVKGKDWLRLRVGFFESRTEANAEFGGY
jgi:hypothetical protein